MPQANAYAIVRMAGMSPTGVRGSRPSALEEFVVVGWSDPEGSRHRIGSLLLGYYTPEGKLIYAGRAGTGMPEAVETDAICAAYGGASLAGLRIRCPRGSGWT